MWTDGTKYCGDFLNGERTGKGISEKENKVFAYYLNFFKKGKFFWTNGDTYDGEFIKGNFNGKG